jgi:hypothetical protein
MCCIGYQFLLDTCSLSVPSGQQFVGREHLYQALHVKTNRKLGLLSGQLHDRTQAGPSRCGILTCTVSMVNRRIIQFWIRQLSSLGYAFLIPLEESKDHRQQLAGNATDLRIFADLLPRFVVVDTFASHQAPIQTSKFVVRRAQGVPGHQIHSLLQESYPTRCQFRVVQCRS